jgi:ketosteroid isomerase-like protein
VAGSWFALFGGPQHLQFILTNHDAAVDGDIAWVTVDENLLDADQAAATVTSLNLFARGPDGAWRMIAHHSTPVAPTVD